MTAVVSVVAAAGVAVYLFGSATRRSWVAATGLVLAVASFLMTWFVDAPVIIPMWVSWLLIPVSVLLGHLVRRERAKRAPGGSHP
jgi:predicted benzoate:H+ symporter BenE